MKNRTQNDVCVGGWGVSGNHQLFITQTQTMIIVNVKDTVSHAVRKQPAFI